MQFHARCACTMRCPCGARAVRVRCACARLGQLVATEVARHERVPPGLERGEQRAAALVTDGVGVEVERRELVVGAQHRRHVRRARVGEQVAREVELAQREVDVREDVSEFGGRERAEPVAAEREGRQMLVAPLLVDDEQLLVERQRPPQAAKRSSDAAARSASGPCPKQV